MRNARMTQRTALIHNWLRRAVRLADRRLFTRKRKDKEIVWRHQGRLHVLLTYRCCRRHERSASERVSGENKGNRYPPSLLFSEAVAR